MSMDPSGERRRGAGPPIPPQDRLWRHPSELGLQADAGPRVVLHRRPSRSRVLVAAAMGLIGGSVLGIGALATSGSLGGGETTTVVEQVAMPVKNRAAGAAELTVAEAALPAVTQISVQGPAGTATATGVMVRDDGLILTTSDVLDAANEVTVTLSDGTAYPAVVVGRDRSSDLGILDIEVTGQPVATLPEDRFTDAVDFGDQVVVVSAAPDAVSGPRVAAGYVTSPSMVVGSDESPMYGMVGVHLAPGTPQPTPGALLLDANGSLLGVTTARMNTLAEESGSVVAYATPFDHARRVFRQVVDTGRFTPPELPVQVAALADADPMPSGVEGGIVVATEPTNPLGVSAGLRRGDVITAINGVPVGSVNDQRTEVRRYTPGDSVEVTVVRGGETSLRNVTLGDDPRLP